MPDSKKDEQPRMQDAWDNPSNPASQTTAEKSGRNAREERKEMENPAGERRANANYPKSRTDSRAEVKGQGDLEKPTRTQYDGQGGAAKDREASTPASNKVRGAVGADIVSVGGGSGASTKAEQERPREEIKGRRREKMQKEGQVENRAAPAEDPRGQRPDTGIPPQPQNKSKI